MGVVTCSQSITQSSFWFFFALIHFSYSNTCSFQEERSFKNRLLLKGFSSWAVVPARKPSLVWTLHRLLGDKLHHYGLQGNFSSSTCCTSLSSLFSDLDVCKVVSLTFSLLLSLTMAAQCFSTHFLTTFSQRHHQIIWQAEPCPAAGPLEPAGPACVWQKAEPGPSHRGHPCRSLF